MTISVNEEESVGIDLVEMAREPIYAMLPIPIPAIISQLTIKDIEDGYESKYF